MAVACAAGPRLPRVWSSHRQISAQGDVIAINFLHTGSILCFIARNL
jgi:hypothetical protein